MSMTLSQRLKDARMEAGLTQAGLASIAKISQQYIDNIEAGRSHNPRKLDKIAAALGKSPEYFLFGENKANSIDIPISSWDNLYSKSFQQKLSLTEKNFCLLVDDDSMTNNVDPKPTFPVGTIIIIDPTIKEYTNKFVIARQKEKPESRPIFRRYGTDHIKEWLAPLNRDFSRYQSYPAKEFDIIGVVVANLNLDL